MIASVGCSAAPGQSKADRQHVRHAQGAMHACRARRWRSCASTCALLSARTRPPATPATHTGTRRLPAHQPQLSAAEPELPPISAACMQFQDHHHCSGCKHLLTKLVLPQATQTMFVETPEGLTLNYYMLRSTAKDALALTLGGRWNERARSGLLNWREIKSFAQRLRYLAVLRLAQIDMCDLLYMSPRWVRHGPPAIMAVSL